MNEPKRSEYSKPIWWSERHTLLWEESLPGLRREFDERSAERVREQMKHLGVNESVFQSVPITPQNVDVDHAYQVADDDWELGTVWDHVEPGMRYGVGARAQYPTYDAWNDEVEARLRQEWNETNEPNTWEKVRRGVRRGFEFVKKVRH